MKKVIRLVVAFAFVLTFSTPAFAGMNKLMDGFVQMIKSPMQLIERPKMGMEEFDLMPVGFMKGLIDVVTFPMD